MLTALAILAAIETAPPPRVEVTLSGSNAAPVSAARRSLSDFARERRLGSKGSGSFSAVETTVPANLDDIPLIVYREEPEAARHEEVVVEQPQPPAYVEAWYPSYGGRRVRPPGHRHPSHLPTVPGSGPRPTPHTPVSPAGHGLMRR